MAVERLLHGSGSGKTPPYGIQLYNARNGACGLNDLYIEKFNDTGASGVKILDDSYSNSLCHVTIRLNTYGVDAQGDQINAFGVFDSEINSNTIGWYHHVGSNETNGVVIGNDTHFEANTTAGIKLESGIIYNFEVDAGYAELTANGEKLLIAKGDGTNSLVIHRLRWPGTRFIPAMPHPSPWIRRRLLHRQSISRPLRGFQAR